MDLDDEAVKQKWRRGLIYTSFGIAILRILLVFSPYNAHRKKFTPVHYYNTCDLISMILKEQKSKFKKIRNSDPFSTDKNGDRYRSGLKLGYDSGEIIHLPNSDAWVYRGWFDYMKHDTVSAIEYYENKIVTMENCFPEWKHNDLIDTNKAMVFTKFTNQNLEMDLFFLKKPNGQKSVIGLVVTDTIASRLSN